MFKSCLGALVAACVAAPTLAQSRTYEETLVRQTYAKIAYLTEVSRVNDTALTTTPPTRDGFQRIMTEEVVKFQLSNFTVGKIADIADMPWSSLVTQKYKMAALLSLSLDSQTYVEGKAKPVHWLQVDATWVPTRFDNVDGTALAWLNSPVSKVLANIGTPGVIYTRYATFTVTSTFEGKSNGPYSAMFLFGKDDKGSTMVTPEDLGITGSAIVGVSKNDVYPYGLLRTSLRKRSYVAEWLSATTAAEPSCVEGQVCCTGDRCGLRALDIQKALSTPLTSTSAN